MHAEKLDKILANRKAQVVVLVLVALLLLFFFVQMYGKAHREMGFDFTSYLDSARALISGGDPYNTGSPFPYVYPLFLAFLLIPLTFLPYWLAVAIWYAANVFSLVYSLRILADLGGERLGLRWGPRLYVPAVALCILLIPVIQNHLLNGQVNFIVLLCCVLFLKFHQNKRPVVAAAFLAAAVSIKLIPAILLYYQLVRREYRTAGLMVLLTAVFCLLPIIFLGGRIWPMYANYFTVTILGAVSANTATMFFSLGGFITYFFPSTAGSTWINEVAILIIIPVMATVDIIACRRHGTAVDSLSFAGYLIAVLLLLPIAETHHLAFIFPALYLIVLHALFDRGVTNLQAAMMTGWPLVCLYLGKLDKTGPFFFLLLSFVFLVVLLLSMRADKYK
ncbi:glycosyltransferase family 87 protein [Candidatus Zixiibacteriota bacterium]